LDDVIFGIRSHHERPDGGGYPQHLRGDQVPLEGRIVGLADGFDAMTSDRTYRKALPLESVVAEIRRNTGTQFAPDAAAALLSMDLPSLLQNIRRAGQGGLAMNVFQEARR
jgi:HD-GYP domain-containing protein (c-di-GMP phosphodiesterase class II)